MSRNVTIVVIILIIVLLAAYLVWLRGRYAQPIVTPVPQATPVVEETPLPTPLPTASPTPSPRGREATGQAKLKTATPAATQAR